MLTKNAARGAVLLLAVAGLASCTKDEPKAPLTPTVSTIVVQTQSMPITQSLPGRTRAFEMAEVRPQINGLVKRRLFDEGSLVRAGQPLYEIDNAPFEAAVASAQGQLARAQAALLSARPKADRYKALVAKDAVSRQEADDALSMVRQAEAEVTAARAELQTARISLDYTQVRAPISGRIGTSSVTAGALVAQNQETPLATIHRLDPIYVDVSLSSPQLLKLRQQTNAGQLQLPGENSPVEIEMEDGNLFPAKGRLEVVNVAVNESTGTVALRAIVPNEHGLLLPGMYVRAQVQLALDDNAMLVPQQSVVRTPKGEPTVLVVGADGKVLQKPVELAEAVGDQWMVTKGLNPGEKVVVEGAGNVRPGTAVKAVTFAPKDSNKAPSSAQPATAGPAPPIAKD